VAIDETILSGAVMKGEPGQRLRGRQRRECAPDRGARETAIARL